MCIGDSCYRHEEVGYAIRATEAELGLVPGTWNGCDFTAMVADLTADLASPPQVGDVFADLPDADPAGEADAGRRSRGPRSSAHPAPAAGVRIGRIRPGRPG